MSDWNDWPRWQRWLYVGGVLVVYAVAWLVMGEP
jgi:hypothetical protein